MKKFLFNCFAYIMLFGVILSLYSCNGTEKIPNNTPIDTGPNSTSNVLAAHWDFYVSDGQYMIGPQLFLIPSKERTFLGDVKYNLKTHTVTSVCVDELCDHKSRSDCKLTEDCIYYFIYENRLYYNRTYYEIAGSYNVVDNNGNPAIQYITETHQCFCSYDLTTGEYRELLNINASEIEQMKRVVLYNGAAYYLRFFPNKQDPKTVEDYTLSLCTMNLTNGKESVLFDATQFLNEHSVLIFIKNDNLYFADNTHGTLMSVDIKGENRKTILDGQGKNIATFNQYGTFMCENWIYYAVDADIMDGEKHSDMGKGYYLYRVNVESNEIECLSQDLVSSFNITNEYIYYFLADRQYTDELTAEAHPVEEECEVIIRISHNGENRENMGYVKKRAIVAWITGGELFVSDFNGGVKFSLTDGKVRSVLSNEEIEQ